METNYQYYKDKIDKFKSEIDGKFFLDTCNGAINFCNTERCTTCMFHELNRNSYGYSCHFAQMISEWSELDYQPIISIDYKKHHFDYNPTTWHGRDDTGRIYCYQSDEKAIEGFKKRIDQLCKDMTKYEYFAKDIEKLSRLSIPFAITEDEQVLPCWDTVKCSNCIFDETKCNIDKLKWADELYQKKEKEIDWTKVPIDTKILVREHEGDLWKSRYFAGYIDGKPYVWSHGATSWSIGDIGEKNIKLFCTSWKYTKLYKED